MDQPGGLQHHAYPNAYSYSDTNPDAYSYPDADANANANANANPDTNGPRSGLLFRAVGRVWPRL